MARCARLERSSFRAHLRVALTLVLMLTALCAPAVRAADAIIDADRTVDFSRLKTFTLRRESIELDRPEINSPLVRSQVTEQVRATLAARGLQEVSQGPADVIVDWSAGGQRFAINEWGRAIPLDEMRGGARIPPGNPWMGLPESFVEGVLVIDLTARDTGLLVWRGVHRNQEGSTAKLAHKLPGYAKKMLATWPPKKAR